MDKKLLNHLILYSIPKKQNIKFKIFLIIIFYFTLNSYAAHDNKIELFKNNKLFIGELCDYKIETYSH